MKRQKSRNNIWRSLAVTIVAGTVWLTGSKDLLAQQSRPVAPAPGSAGLNLLKTRGSLIAQGHNTVPVGHWKLKTFRVEEVHLPTALTVMVRGQQVESNTAWRVTITGGPFPAGNEAAIIWAGDVPLGDAQENPDLSEITVITHDREALMEADTLSVSYGSHHWILPEKPALKNNLQKESAL
jgi:hypothetical protein